MLSNRKKRIKLAIAGFLAGIGTAIVLLVADGGEGGLENTFYTMLGTAWIIYGLWYTFKEEDSDA